MGIFFSTVLRRHAAIHLNFYTSIMQRVEYQSNPGSIRWEKKKNKQKIQRGSGGDAKKKKKRKKKKEITFSGSHLSASHPLPTHVDIPKQMHQLTSSTETSSAGWVHTLFPSSAPSCKGKVLLRLLLLPSPSPPVMWSRKFFGPECACRPEP